MLQCEISIERRPNIEVCGGKGQECIPDLLPTEGYGNMCMQCARKSFSWALMCCNNSVIIVFCNPWKDRHGYAIPYIDCGR